MQLPEKPTTQTQAQPQTHQPAPTQKASDKSIIAWVILGVLIVGGVVAQGIVRSQIESIKNDAKDTSRISSTSWKDYTSTQDDFTVQFPGFPTVENTTIDVQGYTVPYATYERDNDGTYWIVAVTKYPADFDMSDITARLEGSLNGAVQNTQGAYLISSEFVELDGHTAIQGKYAIELSGETFENYYLATLRGNTMYVLLSNSSEADYTTFRNSFRSAP